MSLAQPIISPQGTNNTYTDFLALSGIKPSRDFNTGIKFPPGIGRFIALNYGVVGLFSKVDGLKCHGLVAGPIFIKTDVIPESSTFIAIGKVSVSVLNRNDIVKNIKIDLDEVAYNSQQAIISSMIDYTHSGATVGTRERVLTVLDFLVSNGQFQSTEAGWKIDLSKSTLTAVANISSRQSSRVYKQMKEEGVLVPGRACYYYNPTNKCQVL